MLQISGISAYDVCRLGKWIKFPVRLLHLFSSEVLLMASTRQMISENT